jgi:hypothetical protein
MAACPVCHSELEIAPQHHGTLYTCPNCSAVFFVDWNGQPEGAPSTDQEMETFEPVTAEEFSPPIPVPEPISDFESSEASSFSDITDFGNADVTQAAFSYSVTISGIDSASVYAAVKEALTDSKFGWNTIQIMTQMKDGILTIKSVNAVKASILIQRVKYLPVKVSWRQDVLSSLS